jgi:glycosyltransferase involved in cell wall biosynthesis
VTGYIEASDLCLVPHEDFEHTQTTIPHKLFQYMISEKPVLVSDCRPLARVVRAAGAGRVFQAGNSASFASEVIWMARHPAELSAFGARGRDAALTTFSWAHDASALTSLYTGLDAPACTGSSMPQPSAHA